MKQFTKLTALLAVGAMAPAIAAPSLVSSAHAQGAGTTTSPAGNAGTATITGGAREFQDVPTGHWAYPALQKLAAAGILEGYPPTGNFIGQRPMTRYEFAVAIARLLNAIPPGGTVFDNSRNEQRLNALEARPVPDVTRAEVNDLIDALRREFQDEIARINGRLDVMDQRVQNLESRVPATNRLTTAVSILHRRAFANYIDDGANGRAFLRPDVVGFGAGAGTPFASANQANGTLANYPIGNNVSGFDRRVVRRTSSYTDVEVRLQDRVSDRLSVNVALRSLGSTQEDPWVGDSGGGLYAREAFATLNVGNQVGLNNIVATLGRQRTVIDSGLLYDNQLSPTDQLRYDANLGPIALNAFFGTQNNSGIGSGFGFNGGGNRNDPYGTQGSEFFLNPVTTGNAGTDVATRRAIGFGQGSRAFADDNEALIRGGFNLFRISGQPVQLAYSRLLDGFRSQAGENVALTLPLFNRTIGLELARNIKFEDGTTPQDNSKYAGIVSLNVLRTSILDLNAAYGKAGRNFEFFGASAANPYARTYGEAIFDRPMFLGAPMINGSAGTNIGEPQFLTAKSGFDFNGTVRLPISFLRRVPLDFRYYTAKSGSLTDVNGTGRRRLGEVYSLGTRFNLTPGVDLEVKGGIYNPTGLANNINYVRVGASVGF